MTFREKLQMEHPEFVSERYDGGCKGCPHGYGYEDRREPIVCHGQEACTICWGREMPGKETLQEAMKMVGDAAKEAAAAVTDTKKSLQQLMEEHYLSLSEEAKPPEQKVCVSANPNRAIGSILLECAKTIAYECKQNQNCEGCVFLDNEKACIFAPEGGLFPENWMIPLATLADIEREDEADG